MKQDNYAYFACCGLFMSPSILAHQCLLGLKDQLRLDPSHIFYLYAEMTTSISSRLLTRVRRVFNPDPILIRTDGQTTKKSPL